MTAATKSMPCKLECLSDICISGFEQKTCPIKNKVLILVSRKLKSHTEKSVACGLIPPTRKDIESVFIKSARAGFKCPYCERPLNLWATADLWGLARATSLDHIVPIRSGKSTNQIDNLQLICHQCNTVKSRVDPVHWVIIVDNIKKKGIQEYWRYLDEMYGVTTSKELTAWWHPQGVLP